MGKYCSVNRQRYLIELNISSYSKKFERSEKMSED